jgi:hypothetical protein
MRPGDGAAAGLVQRVVNVLQDVVQILQAHRDPLHGKSLCMKVLLAVQYVTCPLRFICREAQVAHSDSTPHTVIMPK